MKKRFLIALLAVVTLIILGASAVALPRDNTVHLTYNGQEQVCYDANGNQIPSVAIDGVSYVPARLVAELLGAKVNYDSQTNTVELKKSEPIYKLYNYETGQYGISNLERKRADVTIVTTTADDMFDSSYMDMQTVKDDFDLYLGGEYESILLNYQHKNTWLIRDTGEIETDHSHMVVTITDIDTGRVLGVIDTSMPTADHIWSIPALGVNTAHFHQEKVMP